MSNEIIVVEAQPRVLAAEHAPRVGEEARNEFVRDALSENTQRAYEGALTRFRAWMLEHSETELTADVLSRWIAALAEQRRSISSIRQSLAAVRWAMRQAKLPDVGGDHLVRMTLRGIARSHRADQSAPKEPILRPELESMLAAIERMAPALRVLRHGDGGLALFNGSKEETQTLVDLVLTQAGRGGRGPSSLTNGGFQRMQAGRSLLLVDCGAPPPSGLDRFAHAGTLSIELSIGKERLIVNCGAFPAGPDHWHDALRQTAAHSTLVLADMSSSEIRPEGLGRRPEDVKVQRQEANGAHWLEIEHDGWRRSLGAIHRRSLYMAESGEDIRGEDTIEASQPLSFHLRFHLHPDVQASVQQDGEAVLMRLKSGGGWRLRANGARLSLEESIYFGGLEPRRSEQIVLSGTADGPQTVKWAIIKFG